MWFRGRLASMAEAPLPIGPGGLTGGESLFETLRLRSGGFFRLEAHIDRLTAGVRRLGWRVATWGAGGLADAAREACARVAEMARREPDGARVRITVCRLGEEADLWVTAVPYIDRWPREGVRLIRAKAALEERLPWSGLKHGHRLPYHWALQEAAERGAHEAVLVTRSGYLAEGAVSNLFWTRGGRLFTPASDLGILPGITRLAVLEAAEEMGLPICEGAFAPVALDEAEEIFLTNAGAGVAQVVALDGRPVSIGPVSGALREALQRKIARESAWPGGGEVKTGGV